MKTAKLYFDIAWYCIARSVRHPRTNFEDTIGNPVNIKNQSPMPWWGSVAVLVFGVIAWCVSSCLNIPGLDEASRAMVYLPLGNMFNMTRQIKNGG